MRGSCKLLHTSLLHILLHASHRFVFAHVLHHFLHHSKTSKHLLLHSILPCSSPCLLRDYTNFPMSHSFLPYVLLRLVVSYISLCSLVCNFYPLTSLNSKFQSLIFTSVDCLRVRCLFQLHWTSSHLLQLFLG